MTFVHKKIISALLFIGFTLIILTESVINSYASDNDTRPPQSLYAQYAALVDGENNRLLYGKNADKKVPMASTTKIMTCIIAIEYAPLDLKCETSSYASSMPEVKLHASKGEIFCLKDMLYSLMLRSHNDTAVIIAENVASYYLTRKGEELPDSSQELVSVFTGLMNQKAAELGLCSTYYITPNGLDAEDSNGIHSTTAYELAVVMSYCIKNDTFLKITQTHDYSFSSNKRSYSVTNANTFLNMYPGIISGKTGFTAQAGYCYVCAYKDDDRTLIAVVLACGWPYNKSYKWSDCKKLLDYGRKNYTRQVLLRSDDKPKKISYNSGYSSYEIKPQPDISDDITCLLCSDDKVNIVYSYTLPDKSGGITAGGLIGNIDIYINDGHYKSVALKSDINIPEIDYRYYFKFCINSFFVKYSDNLSTKNN